MTKKKAVSPGGKANEIKVDQENTAVSKEQLRQMLKQEMQKQIAACSKEIDESNKKILDKYQCDLELSITVTARGNIPNLAVVPRPPQPQRG